MNVTRPSRARAMTRLRQLTLPSVEDGPSSENELIALCLELGAESVAGWSPSEGKLSKARPLVPKELVREFRSRILDGADPLGDAFCRLRSPAERRARGATYTPATIVDAMVQWARDRATPVRVVDPGSGSGRFLLAAAKAFPAAKLIGVETDPLAAMMARANLAVTGNAVRSRIMLEDFRTVRLEETAGPTLFVGNPPYVRHHLLDAKWKEWLVDEAAKRGCLASQLAGLHVHFFLATAAKARPNDYGVFITAAEWLDVNYGSLVRELFLNGLGGQRIVVVEPTAMPFPDAATTAAITYFHVASKPKKIKLKRVDRLSDLHAHNGNRLVNRERLKAETRWSHLTRGGGQTPAGFIELGELCRVHRGQVTGLNRWWIAGPHSVELPESVLFPCVTKAADLFRAGDMLGDASALRRVIDLPVDLDVFDATERRSITRFLRAAKQCGADTGYIATNRKAWYSVGLREPAPILTTYMARRAPAFVRNYVDARHINIAHGIYPREPVSGGILDRLAEYLRRTVSVTQGRTYAGGLTKFEPREMERILIPDLDRLAEGSATDDPTAAMDSG